MFKEGGLDSSDEDEQNEGEEDDAMGYIAEVNPNAGREKADSNMRNAIINAYD